MSLEYNQKTLYVKNNEIVERKIEDAQLLVNPQTDGIFHLNVMGSAIWRLLVDPITVEEIINTFVIAFPDNPEQTISDDVEKIIRQFLKKDLIQQAEILQPDTTSTVN